MITTPFTSDFYTIFPAPNVEDLLNFVIKRVNQKLEMIYFRGENYVKLIEFQYFGKK